MIGMEPVIENGPSDSRRLLTAMLAAVVLHLCLFAVFAIIRLAERPFETTPIAVDLVPGTLPGLPGAGTGSGGAGVTAVPSRPGPAPSGRASAGGAASDQGFVIPTPRQGAGTDSALQPTGPSFREAGGSAGTQASSAQPATSPVQAPVFPPSRVSGSETTGATTRGGGSGSQTKGVGVLVQGGGQPGVQGSLDLGSLDKSLAAGSGGSGVGGTALAGTGTGGSGSGGSGGGGSGAGSGGGGGSGGGRDYRIRWDQPDSASARRLISSAPPKIPLWVSKEGLTLNVLIAFTLTPDGVLNDVNIEASSGYNDVDAAVMEAIRLWRFSADPKARPVHGLIPYLIQAR